MLIKCVYIVAVLLPAVSCQFDSVFQAQPDVAFGDQNDRFDVTGMTQDNPGLYVEEDDDDGGDARRSYYNNNKLPSLRKTDGNRRNLDLTKTELVYNIDDDLDDISKSEIKPERRSKWVELKNYDETKLHSDKPSRRYNGIKSFIPYFPKPSRTRRTMDEAERPVSEILETQSNMKDMIEGKDDGTLYKRASNDRRHALVNKLFSNLRRQLVDNLFTSKDSSEESTDEVTDLLPGKAKKEKENAEKGQERKMQLKIALPLTLTVKDSSDGSVITGISIL